MGTRSCLVGQILFCCNLSSAMVKQLLLFLFFFLLASANTKQCSDKSSAEQGCPGDQVCCLMDAAAAEEEEDNMFGCCPFPAGVCCQDRLHCCPNGTSCDTESSSGCSHGGVVSSWVQVTRHSARNSTYDSFTVPG